MAELTREDYAVIKELHELQEQRNKQSLMEDLREALPGNIDKLKAMSETLKIFQSDDNRSLGAIYAAMLPIAEEIVSALKPSWA